jgi:hypothetical protein
MHHEEGSTLSVPLDPKQFHEGPRICAGQDSVVRTRSKRVGLVLSVSRVTPCRFEVFRLHEQDRVILRQKRTERYFGKYQAKCAVRWPR